MVQPATGTRGEVIEQQGVLTVVIVRDDGSSSQNLAVSGVPMTLQFGNITSPFGQAPLSIGPAILRTVSSSSNLAEMYTGDWSRDETWGRPDTSGRVLDQFVTQTIVAALSGVMSRTIKVDLSSTKVGAFSNVNVSFFSQNEVPIYGRITLKLTGSQVCMPGYGPQNTNALPQQATIANHAEVLTAGISGFANNGTLVYGPFTPTRTPYIDQADGTCKNSPTSTCISRCKAQDFLLGSEDPISYDGFVITVTQAIPSNTRVLLMIQNWRMPRVPGPITASIILQAACTGSPPACTTIDSGATTGPTLQIAEVPKAPDGIVSARVTPKVSEIRAQTDYNILFYTNVGFSNDDTLDIELPPGVTALKGNVVLRVWPSLEEHGQTQH